MPKFQIVCEYCRKEFTTTRQTRRFCSLSCASIVSNANRVFTPVVLTDEEKERRRLAGIARRKRWSDQPEHANHIRAKRAEWRKKHPGYLGPKRQALVDYVTALKENGVCADCGNKFPACCMDFDHRGEKEQEVGTLVGKSASLEMIQAEIDKCDLVCSNCHRIRTKLGGSDRWTRIPKSLVDKKK